MTSQSNMIVIRICLGNDKVAEILIKNHAEINLKNERGNAPLHIATLNSNDLNQKFDHFIWADNFLLIFVYSHKLDNANVVSTLISNGAIINIPGEKGNMALHFAAFDGSQEKRHCNDINFNSV